MRVIHIAEDGTLFDNEFECRDYEFIISLKDIKKISCYNDDCELMTDLLSQDTYDYGNTIIIETLEALKTFHKIADYCGWCEWDRIDSVGIWKWQDDGFYEKFIKIKEL